MEDKMKLVLTIQEAAILLRVSDRTIRRSMKNGTIQVIKLGQAVRIPVSQFDGLCDEDAVIACVRTAAAKADKDDDILAGF